MHAAYKESTLVVAVVICSGSVWGYVMSSGDREGIRRAQMLNKRFNAAALRMHQPNPQLLIKSVVCSSRWVRPTCLSQHGADEGQLGAAADPAFGFQNKEPYFEKMNLSYIFLQQRRLLS